MKMFAQLATLGVITALSFSALANNELSADMKQMGGDFKAIKAQVNDASKNASTIQLVDDMATAVDAATAQLPDSVSSLPADQQAQQSQAYVALMGELKAKLAELRADLEQNNNASAAAVVGEIGSIKADGHSQFEG